ncbi:MAG: SDR family NAD(P)-dependent oxidoreductase [Nitriliruptor sp.]|nr:MAG: SDR family NAD(P)-dependent oxidoreductase [Nitriliruptor sp.]
MADPVRAGRGEGPDPEGPPTALLTGAAGHLGGSLLRLLPATGDRTIGLDRPGTTPPAEPERPVARWLEIDLAEPDSEVELRAALSDVPRLRLVVAGAGVTAQGGLEATDDATFRRVMDVNYHGALRTARATLPALRAGGGHLVVLSSAAGLVPVPGRPAYVGAKHALTGVFLALADDLARDGVGVTVVHPGFLRTAVTEVGPAAARSTTGAALTADDVARAIVAVVARRRAGRRVPQRLRVGRTAIVADTVGRLSPGLARTLAASRLRAEG